PTNCRNFAAAPATGCAKSVPQLCWRSAMSSTKSNIKWLSVVALSVALSTAVYAGPRGGGGGGGAHFGGGGAHFGGGGAHFGGGGAHFGGGHFGGGGPHFGGGHFGGAR